MWYLTQITSFPINNGSILGDGLVDGIIRLYCSPLKWYLFIQKAEKNNVQPLWTKYGRMPALVLSKGLLKCRTAAYSNNYARGSRFVFELPLMIWVNILHRFATDNDFNKIDENL